MDKKRIKIRYPDIRWLDRVGATSIHEINTETIPTLNLSRGRRETVILICRPPSFPDILSLSLSLFHSFYTRVGSVYRMLINFQDIRDREGKRWRSKRRVSRNTRPTPCEIRTVTFWLHAVPEKCHYVAMKSGKKITTRGSWLTRSVQSSIDLRITIFRHTDVCVEILDSKNDCENCRIRKSGCGGDCVREEREIRVQRIECNSVQFDRASKSLNWFKRFRASA